MNKDEYRAYIKVIANTEITSVSKIKRSPKVFSSGMFSVPFSGKAVTVSHYRVCPNVVV